MNKNDHLKSLREKIVIRGTVTPLTALHIGWQRSFDPVESDAPVIKDPQGNPIIPGSSFKGVLRSFIEGFLDGAELPERLKPCFPTDNESCIDEKEIEKIKNSVAKEKKESEIAKYVTEKACPVCRIFGSSFMGGKLKIKDMPVDKEKWHEAFLRIRDGVVIDRDSRTARDKGKYDFETVSPGVPFSLEIMGDNLEDEEKGLIFTAFDLISQGFSSLGGNVSRGTGRIKIDLTAIEILNTKRLFHQYTDNGKIEPEKKTGDELKKYETEMKDTFFKTFNQEATHV
ncbi:MAG TPA: CRISPR-associated RAMP protein Csx7 [Candidatus Deferrimicrobium sp.]|nr:CRISPR-associated RAMP protein Csx7 [Candidatus Kapabacteria bacterium]HLP60620.1 CRISPR-associated RAMP protein Csx7 [Candidatus Deferrimicrobium sp.]